MGIDISQLFGNAEQATSQGMNDVLNTAGQSALGYLEGQAISVIQADQSQHVATAQKATSEILNRPTVAGSFGAYVSGILQQPVMQQYGPYVIGVGAVIAILLLLKL